MHVLYSYYSLQNQEVQIDYYIYRCDATIYHTIFLFTTALYKLILHAIGLVLAWLTRKVKIDVLNDYKSTVATAICSSILLIVLCITFPVLRNSPFESKFLWTVVAILLVSVHLGWTFIPKVSSYSIL